MLWLLAHSNRLSRILFIFDMPRGSGGNALKKKKSTGALGGNLVSLMARLRMIFAWKASLWDCAWGASLRGNHATPYEIKRQMIRFLNKEPLEYKLWEESWCEKFSWSLPVLLGSEVAHLKGAHLLVTSKGRGQAGGLRLPQSVKGT